MIRTPRFMLTDADPARVRVIVARDQPPAERRARTAVVYLRSAREYELVVQRASCHAAADRLGARVVGEFSDIGSAAVWDRPGITGLLQHLVASPDTDYVIVHRFDRLARSTRQFLAIAHVMGTHGVTLASAG